MTDELKRKAVSGAKWSGVSMVFMSTFHFITLAVLARILSPSDFGLVGMIVVVTGFAQTFSDMGLSNALIHRQHVEEKHLSSLFWMNIVAGIVVFVLILVFKSKIAVFFHQPVLSKYLVFAALLFLLIPLGQVFKTLLQKELQFQTLSKIEMGAMITYSISAISMAMAGYGVLSLIFGQIIRSFTEVFSLVCVYRKKWWPKFYLNIKEIKNYLGFGAFQMGERMVNYLYANIDYIVIGKILGPIALGYYTLAYQLMIFPMSQVNPVVSRVAFPVFSKVQHNHLGLSNGYCKAINFIAMLLFPLLLGMLILAPELIPLIFGPKWESSILVLQILCIVGLFKAIGNPVGPVLLAKGRADWGFYWNVFATVVIAVALLIGVQWGITGAAISILSVQIPLFLIIQPLVNRLIDMEFKKYFEAIRAPLISSLAMTSAIFAFKLIFAGLNFLPLLILGALVGTTTYFIVYYLNDKHIFAELRSLMRSL